MFTLFFRGMILYIAMIFTMRALGKRQLGQFQPYEFAMTILLADVISAPMESVSTPLLHGLLPVAAMIVVYGVITLCSMKSDRLRAFFSGKPAVVVRRGEIDRAESEPPVPERFRFAGGIARRGLSRSRGRGYGDCRGQRFDFGFCKV